MTMSFLTKMSTFVSEKISTFNRIDYDSVKEINVKTLVSPLSELVAERNGFTLYLVVKEKIYHVVYPMPNKTFSIYRHMEKAEGLDRLEIFGAKAVLFRYATEEELLKKLVANVHLHPLWEPIHFACLLGYMEYIDLVRNEMPSKLIHLKTIPEGKLPIHLAVEGQQINNILPCLLCWNPDLRLTDNQANNVFHYAATTEPTVVKRLAESCQPVALKEAINLVNLEGNSPLFLAVRDKNVKCVEALIQAGADAKQRCNGQSALALAFDTGKPTAPNETAKKLITMCPALVSEVNLSSGDCLLHVTTKKEDLEAMLLAAESLDLNVKNNNGYTPLAVHAIRKDLSCVIKLLAHGADVNATDSRGNTVLHWAVKAGEEMFIKTLLIFGSDPNLLNYDGFTPTHVAATQLKSELKGKILNWLRICGAKRCHKDQPGCLPSCRFDPNTTELCHSETPMRTVGAFAFEHKTNEKCLKQSKQLRNDLKEEKTKGTLVNLLCCDGGGIKGLVLVQILLVIEMSLGVGLLKKFKWVAGTSTGGLVAIALSEGKTLREIQRLYFRFKDSVFAGLRTYDTTILENFIKKEFSDSLTMADIVEPKLMITSVLADKQPIRLCLFRNYRLPCSEEVNIQEGFLEPADHYLWKVARCTSAAPSYFSAVDNKYVDGGLVANNPTLDLLRDVQLFNSALEEGNLESEYVRVGCVLSVGTGKSPEIASNCRTEVGIPGGPIDAFYKMLALRELSNMLVDQVTATDGSPVDRARAWSHSLGVPFFRFSTPLTFRVEMDTKEDVELIKMLWETVEYMAESAQLEDIRLLVDLINHE